MPLLFGCSFELSGIPLCLLDPLLPLLPTRESVPSYPVGSRGPRWLSGSLGLPLECSTSVPTALRPAGQLGPLSRVLGPPVPGDRLTDASAQPTPTGPHPPPHLTCSPQLPSASSAVAYLTITLRGISLSPSTP